MSIFTSCPLCGLENKLGTSFFGRQPNQSAGAGIAGAHSSQSSQTTQNQKTHQYQPIPPKQPKKVVQKSNRKVSFLSSFYLLFINYFSFYGRSCRSAFWPPLLVYIVIDTILAIRFSPAAAPTNQFISTGEAFAILFRLAFVVPVASLIVRRLHDIGKRGWWLLIIPLTLGLGGLLILYWAFRKGDYGTNAHGDDLEEGQGQRHASNVRRIPIYKRIIVLPIFTLVPLAMIEWLFNITGFAMNSSAEDDGSGAEPLILVAVLVCFGVFIAQSLIFKTITSAENNRKEWIDLIIISVPLIVFIALFVFGGSWMVNVKGSWQAAEAAEEIRNDIIVASACVVGGYFPLIDRIKKYLYNSIN